MRLPDDMDPIGRIDKMIYSILDGDNAILEEYIQMMGEIFSADIFREHLKFLYDIRLKCLPKLYKKLRSIKPSDFVNCQVLHKNLINTFGNRILDACRGSDSFVKCLNDAKNILKNDYDNIEEDIIEIYINEIVAGRNTCMGDIIVQLKKFSDIVYKECR